MAINSLEKVLASTVFWRLLYHIIGARLRNMMKPVWLLRVTLLAAWEASTYAVVVTGDPNGSGDSCVGGSSSFASLY